MSGQAKHAKPIPIASYQTQRERSVDIHAGILVLTASASQMYKRVKLEQL
jgi:hypothetical protein